MGLLLVACGSDDDDNTEGGGGGGGTPTVSVKVSTPVVSSITTTSAVVTASATGPDIKSRGVCYSTAPNPTINDNKLTASTENITVSLSSLKPGTTYHVRAYAQTASTYVYSSDVTFNTIEEEKVTWTAPTYPDDYRTLAGWENRSKWNLANVHDPSVMKAEDGYYYMYCTDAGFGNPQAGHGHFHCRRSTNLVDWEYLGATMPNLPSWVQKKLNDIRAAMGLGASTANLNNCGYWAPCVRKVKDGLYRMYYVITIDGTIDGPNTWGERAFIGLMETSTPANVNSWVDKGYVITNYSDRELNYKVNPTSWEQCYYKYNAIDPSYIITPNGEHWLAYGSWHSGFAIVKLNPETGKTITDPLPNPWGKDNEAAYGKRIFTRNASSRWQGAEAPEIIYHDGYYYLFLAYDALDVPYNTRVVRSANIEGPYLGINGTDVTKGGDAYPILTHPYKFANNDGWVGISHCAVFDDGNGNWYYASQGRFPVGSTSQPNWAPNAIMLGHVRSIVWTKDGWPVVLPERYAAVPQTAISENDLVGKWENIDLGYEYGKQKTSTVISLTADHKASGGPWNGKTWTFDAASNTLTIGDVSLVVRRECDWEASPRRATIVYAGFAKTGRVTYWGKKSAE